MSVQASTRVMEYSEAAGVNRLVLLVMANRAGGDLDECFASVERLAFECRVDHRTVQRAIARLVKAGDLLPVGIHPKHRTNIYRVMPATTVSMFAGAGVAESHPPVTSDAPAPPERKELRGSSSSTGSSLHTPPLRAERARPRDELFETLAEVTNLDIGDLTRSARGKLNNAAKQLRDVGATVEDIRSRAAIYRRVHPTWDLTPTSLASWWPSLNGATAARPAPDRGLDDSWLFEGAGDQ